jgi:hypothetical protein
MTKTAAAITREVQQQQNAIILLRLRVQWFNSGSELTFRQWYDERTERLVASWFKVA